MDIIRGANWRRLHRMCKLRYRVPRRMYYRIQEKDGGIALWQKKK